MKQGEWEILDETAAEIEMAEFLHGLIRVLKPGLVVETGCYIGNTTQLMGMACKANGKGKVVTCDVDADRVEQTKLVCYDLPVEVRHCSSDDVPELEQADLLFVDSDYAKRPMEISRAKAGAVVVVHDTRVSYDSEIAPLEGLVHEYGGLTFNTYRGFGLLVK